MPKTTLIIHLVIEEDTGIAKQGTISVRRGDLGHIRVFKTTKAADTVYAIEQALQELAELERKAPAKPAKAKSKSKPPRPSLKDAPDVEAEDTAETDEDEATSDSGDQADAPATIRQTEPDALHYDLIRIMGADQSPAAYKHAALLAELLRSEKLWNNTTKIIFENPVEAWTQLQAGTLSLQEVISLYTFAPASPVPTRAPVKAEPLTA